MQEFRTSMLKTLESIVPPRPLVAVAARKPVGNSASSAQAEALAVPALAVFQRSARQLTKFQQKTLLWLGLVTLGPKDTAGDGECMYRAISQQLSMLQPERGTIWTLQHSEQAQSGFPGLRIKAAEEVSSNAWLQQRLISDSALLVSKSAANPNHADILKKAMRRKAPSALPDVLAAKVKIPIAEGGIWGGDFEMRALSLKFQREIIVVAPSQVCYYPWDKEVTSACKGEEGSFPFIGFNDGGSSIQKEKFDLPDAAFHPSSLIVMYNGRDHFWANIQAA
ncbi:hypothetical protein ABBQ38_008486 [Trebouxia sp. C0009 RCD-2024]